MSMTLAMLCMLDFQLLLDLAADYLPYAVSCMDSGGCRTAHASIQGLKIARSIYISTYFMSWGPTGGQQTSIQFSEVVQTKSLSYMQNIP